VPGPYRDAFHQHLGAVIRRRRAALSLSQEKLAELVGVHRTYVSVLELGQKSPTVAVFRSIATALGTAASELLAEAEKASRRA
jgi:transcriptional regulator with XRE-family HTH domain